MPKLRFVTIRNLEGIVFARFSGNSNPGVTIRNSSLVGRRPGGWLVDRLWVMGRWNWWLAVVGGLVKRREIAIRSRLGIFRELDSL
jgi:hypothetical protein